MTNWLSFEETIERLGKAHPDVDATKLLIDKCAKGDIDAQGSKDIAHPDRNLVTISPSEWCNMIFDNRHGQWTMPASYYEIRFRRDDVDRLCARPAPRGRRRDSFKPDYQRLFAALDAEHGATGKTGMALLRSIADRDRNRKGRVLPDGLLSDKTKCDSLLRAWNKKTYRGAKK